MTEPAPTYSIEPGVTVETALENLARAFLAEEDKAERYEGALHRILGLGWQERYIGPWIQEEAWRIAHEALEEKWPTS